MSKNNRAYPIIDLFAGPGGLGEGFASLYSNKGEPVFRSVISIEKEEFAHNTLRLRHFFRSFPKGKVPKEYYDYISGELSLEALSTKYPAQWEKAISSAVHIELGEQNHDKIQHLISKHIGRTKKWVLVGGPPCQAYSLVGRSRRMHDPLFETDEKHFLYKEYLRIIIDHKPPVFVMENVKGLLSAKIHGELVVTKILRDLANPVKAIGNGSNGLKYRLYSLSHDGNLTADANPKLFVIKAEDHGIPQARHRMFVVGIRSDIDLKPRQLRKRNPPCVKDVIGDLPRIRSGISKQEDSVSLWRKIIGTMATSKRKRGEDREKDLEKVILSTIARIVKAPTSTWSKEVTIPTTMKEWFSDKKLKALTGHEARAHMESDILRYMFASCYAKAAKASPKLSDFPTSLLPNHRNVAAGCEGSMFSDRFRVQLADRVSTTITSHISKDGHYFIHYDPMQCRSLTVREAARLQTFPDNYHFEGPRTSQYHQVGNAVPPYLARQISEVIAEILDSIPDD
ncbi:MAG: DNA cytosine methyltransferase [Alphaproteobacteria bacterium]|nr:DNA cytosine methyltransferase [Alphaproteobacteria bacterium]